MLIEPPFLITDVSTHSMEHYLIQYITPKIHPEIDLFQGCTIVVRGNYERSLSIISTKEKNDKLFNWKRPSAEYSLDKSILYINCFPGIDYVFHYALLIKTYLASPKGDRHLMEPSLQKIRVFIETQPELRCYNQLIKTNLVEIPLADVIVLGKVEYLISSDQWKGNGDFLWLDKNIGNKKCLFVGCSFSYWGNIAGKIVSILSNKTNAIFYVGKLGCLCGNVNPNEFLATGNTSMLNSQQIEWNNSIVVPPSITNVLNGNHVTMSSPIMETKSWLHELHGDFMFVDPEIGHMASATKALGVQFGYIHIISDNVAKMQEENLSNERAETIVSKRKKLYHQLREIIDYSSERL